MPALAEEYEHVTPEYKTLPGWNETTYGVKDGGKLPKAAVDCLGFIADFLQIEIGMLSTGPERDATIVPAGQPPGAGGWKEATRGRPDTPKPRESKQKEQPKEAAEK